MTDKSAAAIREYTKKWGIVYEVDEPGYYYLKDRSKECLSELTALLEQYKEVILRDELIKFNAWGYGSFTDNQAIIDDVDEYLKSLKP